MRFWLDAPTALSRSTTRKRPGPKAQASPSLSLAPPSRTYAYSATTVRVTGLNLAIRTSREAFEFASFATSGLSSGLCMKQKSWSSHTAIASKPRFSRRCAYTAGNASVPSAAP